MTVVNRVIALVFTVLLAASCSNNGSSSANPPVPNNLQSNSNGNVPYGNNGNMLFTTNWRVSYNYGYTIIQFTPTSVTTTNYCENGLVVSITAPAIITSTSIQVTTQASRQVQGNNGSTCYVNIAATAPQPYTVLNGQFCTDGNCAQAYPY